MSCRSRNRATAGHAIATATATASSSPLLLHPLRRDILLPLQIRVRSLPLLVWCREGGRGGGGAQWRRGLMAGPKSRLTRARRGSQGQRRAFTGAAKGGGPAWAYLWVVQRPGRDSLRPISEEGGTPPLSRPLAGHTAAPPRRRALRRGARRCGARPLWRPRCGVRLMTVHRWATGGFGSWVRGSRAEAVRHERGARPVLGLG